MTEDGISRRQVLRAASVAGGLGIASGAGTQALLSDTESFLDGGFGAGTLDLSVQTEDLTGTDPCEWNPSFTEETETDRRVRTGTLPIFSKPSGVVGIALTVCDNPGRVTLELERNEDDDDPDWPWPYGGPKRSDGHTKQGESGGRTESTDRGKPDDRNQSGDRTKPADPDQGQESDPKVGVSSGGEPRSKGGVVSPNWWWIDDEPSVELRAGDCEGTLLAEGELSSVVASLEGGIPLKTDCAPLGKLEARDDGETFTAEDGDDAGEDTFVFDYDGEDVTVRLGNRQYKDGDEVIGVDLELEGASLCRVAVKGGGKPSFHGHSEGDAGTKTFGGPHHGGGDHGWGSGVTIETFDCATAATVTAGENPAGKQSAISNLELFVCGDGPCVPCAPDDPFKLFLYWEGGLGAEDVDFVFSAEQCRHTGDGGTK